MKKHMLVDQATKSACSKTHSKGKHVTMYSILARQNTMRHGVSQGKPNRILAAWLTGSKMAEAAGWYSCSLWSTWSAALQPS